MLENKTGKEDRGNWQGGGAATLKSHQEGDKWIKTRGRYGCEFGSTNVGERHAKGRGKASVTDVRQKQSGMFRDMSDKIRREWVEMGRQDCVGPVDGLLIRDGF